MPREPEHRAKGPVFMAPVRRAEIPQLSKYEEAERFWKKAEELLSPKQKIRVLKRYRGIAQGEAREFFADELDYWKSEIEKSILSREVKEFEAKAKKSAFTLEDLISLRREAAGLLEDRAILEISNKEISWLVKEIERFDSALALMHTTENKGAFYRKLIGNKKIASLSEAEERVKAIYKAVDNPLEIFRLITALMKQMRFLSPKPPVFVENISFNEYSFPEIRLRTRSSETHEKQVVINEALEYLSTERGKIMRAALEVLRREREQRRSELAPVLKELDSVQRWFNTKYVGKQKNPKSEDVELIKDVYGKAIVEASKRKLFGVAVRLRIALRNFEKTGLA